MEVPFRTYFKSVHIEGRANLPKHKPVFIAASHAGSFLDGVVIEYTNYEKIFTLVRGDAFNKPTFNKLLRSMLLLPIYRSQDAHIAKAKLGNANTADECYELFLQNRNILIFSEGIAYPEKSLRKLKKGTAAMAADFIRRSKGDLDMHIVPCAINYSQFGAIRTSLQIIYGQDIRVADYINTEEKDDIKFARSFTDLLEKKLQEIVVKTKGEFEEEKEFAHEMLINEFDKRTFFRQYNTGSEIIAAAIDKVDIKSAEYISEYKSLLSAHKITDRSLSANRPNFIAILVALSTFAFSLPAALVYALWWKYAKSFTKKKIKNIVLFDSVHFGMGLVGTILCYLLAAVLIFGILPLEWSFIWKCVAFIMTFVGCVAWFTAVEEGVQIYTNYKYASLPSASKSELEELRKTILSTLRQ